MNTIKNRRYKHWLCMVLAAVVLIGIPAAPVYAAEPAEEGEHLETLYQRELDLLEKQAERLAKTDEVVSRVEEYISNQQEQGADTTEAEQALAAFEGALPSIHSYYEEAETILNEHAGFDINGNMTDSVKAFETVSSAGSAQRRFHLNLVQAFKDLRTSLKDSHTCFRLEEGYQRLLKAQQAQADVLEAGEDVINRLNTFIAEQQEMGRDTGNLETAKQEFLTANDLASGNFEEAGSILQEHAGFDTAGMVTDPDQAQNTVTSAGSAQRQFHLTATMARINLRSALQEYRDSIDAWDE
ncbi:MAG: hypothetical protein JXA25_20545 [Anaerolineales bacterium]|nr:hypothetical protein [Anaerolineales bacterium]